eukprot:CAMPEP_0170527534 /NCGR_PEP_ID=MMETSP0209-20121228/13001_1 /TAXON_ID=665100 ORGANISM="Litonotus pictus, Strain P1" /NCGR_SAMPLE_ID=MMETSP0209 /ASSEMBLY_ACC=CAM_ASM_000301 /LENGTH=125 /DNA_ID=CAMNT_0010818123 /DNA_START=26 /DNA_END=400 /DNA_ORIENTATION=+
MAENGSINAMPTVPGEKMAYQVTLGNPRHYSGYIENHNANFDFYFNIESELFLCITILGGKKSKMTGELRKGNKEGLYVCSPNWATNPMIDTVEWREVSKEDIKEFDLSGKELDMNGTKLKLISE